MEQDIIRIVSAIPAQADNWTDDRSRIARLTERIIHGAETAKEFAIKEKWTKKIVGELTDLARSYWMTLGHGHNHVYVSHDLKRHNNHWTYDVVWIRGNELKIDGVTLAAQCRWSGMWHALNELLIIRAEHRVLIDQGSDFGRDFEQLAYRVQASKLTQPGDRYLLLLFDRKTQAFKSGVYVA